MAYQKGNTPPNRNDDRGPPKPPRPVDLDYPKMAEEAQVPKDVWTALRNMYPAAAPESVIGVWAYCTARDMDPLLKPVHIVPMWNDSLKAMVDVIMPGIQELRMRAAKTKEYAGQEEVIFGPMIEVPVDTGNPGSGVMRAPEFATITVLRLVGGKPCKFSKTEFFAEAVARNQYGKVNAMWMKRPRGQLEKCAEAGALRKGFPTETGGEYAAEEMEGREHPGNDVAEHGASGIPGPEVVAEVPAAASVEKAVAGTQAALREEGKPSLGAANVEHLQKVQAERDAAMKQKLAEMEANDRSKIEQGLAKKLGELDALENSKPAVTEGEAKLAAREAAREARLAELKREEEQAARESEAAGMPDPEAIPDPEPVAPPATQPTEFKIDLPVGAMSVLKAEVARRGATLEALLGKMGKDIVPANINEALALLKGWGK
jgi:phage recombination protein Bet